MKEQRGEFVWLNRAGCSVLGRASNTEIYRPLENHSKVSENPIYPPPPFLQGNAALTL